MDRGSLGTVRSAIFLVLLTLLSPSIASVICGVTCINAERKAAASAPASCHGQAPDDDRDALSGGGVCHEQPLGEVSAMAKLEPQRTPFVVQPALEHDFGHAFRALTTFPTASAALPRPVLTATPLRI